MHVQQRGAQAGPGAHARCLALIRGEAGLVADGDGAVLGLVALVEDEHAVEARPAAPVHDLLQPRVGACAAAPACSGRCLAEPGLPPAVIPG